MIQIKLKLIFFTIIFIFQSIKKYMFYTMTVLCRVPEFIFPFEVLFAFLIFLTLILCKRCYS